MHNVKMINELILNTETVIHRYSVKKLFLEIRKIASLFFSIKKIFIKKETLAQVFCCEFCDISNKHLFLQNTSGGCFWEY